MQTFLIFLLVGFIAQMIDGTLGMAYGVSCNTFLLTAGIPPAIASASVHFAEIFTTLASGISHFKMKNIDKKIFLRLLVPGVLGGVIGAYILSSFDGGMIAPFVNAYLVVMGIVILIKMVKPTKESREVGKAIYGLGLVGGFCDAIGGGGWGPVVTSTLVASGHDLKKTIGSVNTAEFFVTLAQSITFFTILGFMDNMTSILGLIVGGVIAAPFAAYFCKKIPVRPLLGIVGAVIIFLNARSLILFFM